MSQEIRPGESHIPDNSTHFDIKTTKPSSLIDHVITRIGELSSWLWLTTMVVILSSVISRYVFESSSIVLEELSWHFYGIAWLLALSFAVVHDDHVRVDLFHERFSEKTKTWIELLGICLLLLPFLVVILIDSIPYFLSSFELNERSLAPDGLPARWFIKLFLPISIFLLILAAISRLFKCTSNLFGWPRQIDQKDKQS